MNLALNLFMVLFICTTVSGLYDLPGPPFKSNIYNYEAREQNVNNTEPPGQTEYSSLEQGLSQKFMCPTSDRDENDTPACPDLTFPSLEAW